MSKELERLVSETLLELKRTFENEISGLEKVAKEVEEKVAKDIERIALRLQEVLRPLANSQR